MASNAVVGAMGAQMFLSEEDLPALEPASLEDAPYRHHQALYFSPCGNLFVF